MFTPSAIYSARSAIIDRILCLSVPPILIAGLILKLTHPDIFLTAFAQEDGPVENTTAIALGLTGLVCACRSARFWQPRRKAALASLVLAIAFLWSSGEEISWGQRIFGWQTTGFFATHNKQHETNLHNLIIGGHHLARLLFGNLLSAVLLVYFLVLPPLWRRVPPLRRWTDSRAIPVPATRHTLLILAACLTTVIAPDQNRIWEIFECAFALIALGLTLHPLNVSALATQTSEMAH